MEARPAAVHACSGAPRDCPQHPQVNAAGPRTAAVASALTRDRYFPAAQAASCTQWSARSLRSRHAITEARGRPFRQRSRPAAVELPTWKAQRKLPSMPFGGSPQTSRSEDGGYSSSTRALDESSAVWRTSPDRRGANSGPVALADAVPVCSTNCGTDVRVVTPMLQMPVLEVVMASTAVSAGSARWRRAGTPVRCLQFPRRRG
jgi:hypothetical protein